MQKEDYRFASCPVEEIPATLLCRTRQAENSDWVAYPDLGFEDLVSWPSFSRYSEIKEMAEQLVKDVVVDRLGNYDLRYRVGPYIARKQRFIEAGVDPEPIINTIRKGETSCINYDANWWDVLRIEGVDYNWTDRLRDVRNLEFLYQLLVVEAKLQIEVGETTADDAISYILHEIPENACRTPIEGTRRERIQDFLSERLESELILEATSRPAL